MPHPTHEKQKLPANSAPRNSACSHPTQTHSARGMARACFVLGLAITALQAAVVLLLIWRSDGWTAHPLGRTVPAPEAASARPADDDGLLAISVMRLAVPDRSTSSPNLTTHVVSCPLYSGPGYDAKRHASREVTLPAFEAPFASTPRPPTLSVEAVPLSDVRLTPGSAFHAAFETNLQYLKVRVRVRVRVGVRVRVSRAPAARAAGRRKQGVITREHTRCSSCRSPHAACWQLTRSAALVRSVSLRVRGRGAPSSSSSEPLGGPG